MIAILALLSNTWFGYSYSGDPGIATGYGIAEFQSATYWDGWLSDNSAQGYRLMFARPVPGTSSQTAAITWWSSGTGQIWQCSSSVGNAPGGYRVIEFQGPGGPIAWIVEPGQ